MAERLTITVDEAAEMLGISRNTAFKRATTGELPTIRLGRRLLVPKAAIERMLGIAIAPANSNTVEGRGLAPSRNEGQVNDQPQHDIR